MSSANPNIIERQENWARKTGVKPKPATRSENRLPPGQHPVSGFPVLDLGIRPDVSLEDWRLEVVGLVESPKTFTWEEFNALPRFEYVSDFHCVTTWSKFDCRWSGVAFFSLAEIVKPERDVKHPLFTSYDSYSTNSGSKIAWPTMFSLPHISTASQFRESTAAQRALSFPNCTPGKVRSSCAQSSSRPRIDSVSGNCVATAIPPIPGPRTAFLEAARLTVDGLDL